jgi:hypothetical protein
MVRPCMAMHALACLRCFRDRLGCSDNSGTMAAPSLLPLFIGRARGLCCGPRSWYKDSVGDAGMAMGGGGGGGVGVMAVSNMLLLNRPESTRLPALVNDVSVVHADRACSGGVGVSRRAVSAWIRSVVGGGGDGGGGSISNMTTSLPSLHAPGRPGSGRKTGAAGIGGSGWALVLLFELAARGAMRFPSGATAVASSLVDATQPIRGALSAGSAFALTKHADGQRFLVRSTKSCQSPNGPISQWPFRPGSLCCCGCTICTCFGNGTAVKPHPWLK